LNFENEFIVKTPSRYMDMKNSLLDLIIPIIIQKYLK
jgi:hypothetical protein